MVYLAPPFSPFTLLVTTHLPIHTHLSQLTQATPHSHSLHSPLAHTVPTSPHLTCHTQLPIHTHSTYHSSDLHLQVHTHAHTHAHTHTHTHTHTPQQEVLWQTVDGAASVQDGQLSGLQRERLVVNGGAKLHSVPARATREATLARAAAGEPPPGSSQPNR